MPDKRTTKPKNTAKKQAKKTISDRKRLANRRNARKSTGPKTPQGKTRSSRNALKHGLLAREVIIDDGDGIETRADFDSLLADLREEFTPRSVIEETLVERIATCYWRLRRAQRYEIGAIRDTLDECNRPDDKPPPELSALHRRLDRVTERLSDEQRLLTDLENPPDLSDPDNRDTVESALREFAVDHRIDPENRSLDDLHRAILDAQRSLVHNLRDEVARLQTRLTSARHYADLRRARRPLVGSLPVQDTLIKLVRYETMLDRQLHRALTELRRRNPDVSQPDPAPEKK